MPKIAAFQDLLNNAVTTQIFSGFRRFHPVALQVVCYVTPDLEVFWETFLWPIEFKTPKILAPTEPRTVTYKKIAATAWT